MPTQIVTVPISRVELRRIAEQQFGDFVKAVVDVQRRIMAIGADLHADEEAVLIEDGSHQADLWGINIYFDQTGERLIEFDSMINVRPSQGNRSRAVEDIAVQRSIRDIVERLVGA
ncbi:MAG TPA: DUF5674 family protein [Candidatus Bathyarchaeia archaeon]|nr:DUF5674 family protein [Candidatus Bathyarchaeia archaeon]